MAENIKNNNNWLCPYCTGACYCTRCMRNEKMLQLIAYYFSIDGNIYNLYDDIISTDSIIDKLNSNYILNNVFFIVYDKDLSCSQMMENFMNYDYESYRNNSNKEQKEKEIDEQKKYIMELTKLKNDFNDIFEKYYQDKQNIQNIFYEEFDEMNDKDIKININLEVKRKYDKRDEGVKTRYQKETRHNKSKDKKIKRKEKKLMRRKFKGKNFIFVKNE